MQHTGNAGPKLTNMCMWLEIDDIIPQFFSCWHVYAHPQCYLVVVQYAVGRHMHGVCNVLF